MGGAESLGISTECQTVLARLVEFQIWPQFTSSVRGKDLEKGQWLLLSLMPDISVPPYMPAMPFKLLPPSSEGMSLSR